MFGRASEHLKKFNRSRCGV